MSGAAQLLRGGKAGGARPDHRDAESRASPRRTRYHPTFSEPTIGDRLLDVPDGDRLVHEAKHARRLAWSRAETSRELRKIVRGLQRIQRLAPVTALHQT